MVSSAASLMVTGVRPPAEQFLVVLPMDTLVFFYDRGVLQAQSHAHFWGQDHFRSSLRLQLCSASVRRYLPSGFEAPDGFEIAGLAYYLSMADGAQMVMVDPWENSA